jgi:putative ABC transport system permease protein
MASPPSSTRASPRESASVRIFSGAATDLRIGLRQLWKSRGFATITLLTLALCIGANTAIFSAVYALMLKPLPFTEPERIVEIYNTYGKAGLSKASSNPVQYTEYKQQTTAFASLGLWAPFQGMFGEDTTAERLSGARVTADLFDVLGLKPLIGQFFTEANQRPNEDKVLVLTQSFWETQYQEDGAHRRRDVHDRGCGAAGFGGVQRRARALSPAALLGPRATQSRAAA